MTREVAPVARRRPKRAKEQIVEIPVSLIDTGLNNRTVFDEDELAELARDIAERGLLQVPCVRPVGSRYQLVYGERRFRACLLLGWTLLPLHDEYQKMLRKGQLELNLAELMVNLDHNRQAVAVRVLTSVSRRPTIAEFRRVVGDLLKEQVAEQQQGMLFPDLEQVWREKLEAAAATGKRARKQRLPLNPAIPAPPRFKRNWWFANQMHDYAEQLRTAGFTEGGDAIDHVVEMAIDSGILEADESQF